jgi:hypothetical protein
MDGFKQAYKLQVRVVCGIVKAHDRLHYFGPPLKEEKKFIMISDYE